MEPVPNGFKIYHKKENKMNHKKTAKDIIDYAGGKENIKAVEHCATRLRIEVLEEDKIQKEEIEELEGVKENTQTTPSQSWSASILNLFKNCRCH